MTNMIRLCIIEAREFYEVGIREDQSFLLRPDQLPELMAQVKELLKKQVIEGPPSAYHPMTREIDLKHLGKLVEELCECTAAVSRCIIQGIDESEPVTGKLNREWLEDECADVLANIQLVIEHFRLNPAAMAKRTIAKKTHLRKWHEMLATAPK